MSSPVYLTSRFHFGESPRMLQVRIAIHLPSLGLPLKKAIKAASRLGVDAVEINGLGEINPQSMTRTAIRQIRKMLEDAKLRLAAVTCLTTHGFDIQNQVDERVDTTKQVMKMAYELGAGVVVNRVGQVPEELQGPQWELLQQALEDLGRHGMRVGALLAAKTGSEPAARMLQMIDALPDGSLAAALDPGALIASGFSASDGIDLLAPHTLHAYASDGVPDPSRGRGMEVQLGRGIVDLAQLLGVLEQQRYRGYLSIERRPGPTTLQEIADAVQYIRSFE